MNSPARLALLLVLPPLAWALSALAPAQGEGGAATGEPPSAQELSEATRAWLERLPAEGRSHVLTDLSGDDCIRCHQAIGEEWRTSLHALAWQDEHYQRELKKIRRKSSCYPCHIPQPLSTTLDPETGEPAQKPTIRAEDRHLGVHCTSCHLAADGETILGPAGRETDAHPTAKSELFDHERTNALCVSCHATTVGPVIGIAKDFVDTAQHELGLSCVGCHMPGVSRPWASPEDEGGEPYPDRRGRSHRLMTPRDPEFLREAFSFDVAVENGKTVLSIQNECGHRVPGLIERRFLFDLELFDADGDSVGEAEHVIDNRAYLPVEESIDVEVDGVGATLKLRGRHEMPGVRFPVVFLERELAVE